MVLRVRQVSDYNSEQPLAVAQGQRRGNKKERKQEKPDPKINTHMFLRRFPSASPRRLDERRQSRQRLRLRQEGMSEKVSRRRSLVGIDFERDREEIAEHDRELLRVVDSRRAVRRDQVQRAERLLVEIWRFAFDHFDRHNAERPNVDFGAILFAGDDFGRHPVRRTDHRCSLRIVALDLSAEPKVGCTSCVEKESVVGSFDRRNRREGTH